MTSVTSILGAVLPDPGSPVFVPVMGFIGGVLGAALAKASGARREEVHERAEDVSLMLGGLALIAYVFGLVTGLY